MSPTAHRPPNKEIGRRVLDSARKTITEFDMICPGDTVLIGVSGGPDSVALLNVMNQLVPELSLKLAAAHLNHGLRKEAAEEAAFVASICDSLGLTCHIGKEDVNRHRRRHKLSVEEAGRKLRYAFYKSLVTVHGYDKIALGHHADDNAELILMFMLRGCGPAGFSGIPPIRDGIIIRPLIRLTRKDILSYLEATELRSLSDRSNQDNRFLRNRIRNKLIPHLQKYYNPQIVPALNRLSDILREESTWMTGVTASHYNDVQRPEGKGQCQLSAVKLMRLPKAARRRVIRMAISEVKGDLRRITFAHVEAILRLIESKRQRPVVALPGGLAVRRIDENLCIFAGDQQKGTRAGAFGERRSPSFLYRVERPQPPRYLPVVVHIEEIGWRITFALTKVADLASVRRTGQGAALFDMSSLNFPLILRNAQPGDRFTPYGLQGSQKVKKYFIDHKVPRERRWECPVLVSGDRIAWLVGHRIADGCKVTPNTGWVLRAELAC
jgi:tRNA(Ile)-lysidine synthase